MKKMTIFYFPACPHCRNALKWQEELFEEHPEYKDIPIELVDEKKDSEYADKFDYYFVPTYYLDGVKLHEGVKNRDLVADAFKKAYNG